MNREENVTMVSEMMDVATEKLPQLIKSLFEAVYSPESAREFGRAVGAFYGGLVEAGIPSTDALRMAEDYAKSLRDIGSAAAYGGKPMQFGGQRPKRRHHPERKDAGEELEDEQG